MLNKKGRLAAALLCLFFIQAISVKAQTIDELTSAARAKKFNELKTANASAPANAASTSNATGIIPAFENSAASKKGNIYTDLYLLSIYGIGTQLIAEMADEGMQAKYKVGDKTPSGWTVTAIHPRSVELKKLGKHGKAAASKTLSFWVPVEGSSFEGSNTKNVGNGVPVVNNLPPIPLQSYGGK